MAMRRESMRKIVQEQLHAILEKTGRLTLVG